MPRYVPPLLKEHLESGATTVCFLLRIEPVTPGYEPYGLTDLDADIDYDDGQGSVTYLTSVGFESSTLQSKANLDAANAEAKTLMPAFEVPFSEADIRGGALDYAKFALYLVNYEDLTMGHAQLHGGTLGRNTVTDSGLSIINELRGLSAQLQQSICTKDSLSCRAIFGSQQEGSSTPGPQVTHDWCGFDATSLLVADEVASVGLETTLTFTLAGVFVEPAGGLSPGIVKFLTGANAGRTYEIADNTDDGTITLAMETDFPISVGDELEYRVDCSKQARDDAKGCRKHFGPDWILHFRGEPDIPIGDESAMFTPGAGLGPGDGGAVYIPEDEAQ